MLGRRKLVHTRRHGSATAVGRNLRRAALVSVLVAGVLAGWVPPSVAAAPVTITTAAEAGVGVVSARATLAGGDNPTGTVTFRLFGPADDTCARSPVFTSTNPVTGAGVPRHATSDRFAPPAQGIYHFVATYSGDGGNAPAGPTACGDPDAAIGWASSSFAFSARASGPVVVGGAVSDTATIATSSDPTGTMSFALFGPDVASCTGTPAFTSARAVHGSGSYTSEPFVPAAPGIYRWVARYSGDADDPSAMTPCDDPNQQVQVTAAPDGAGAGAHCIIPAPARAAIERRMAAYRQALQALGDHPLAALFARAGGQVEAALTACRAAMPPR